MQTVSFAGSTYNIPDTRGDRPWSGLSDFVIAAASKALNTGGGAFTLLADINLGASFGLVSTYYKSRTASVASAGQIRLANADTIKFRNTLNNADLSVAISSNRLTFEGSRLVIAGAAEIVNADVSASAAIAYSKLNLATSIVNADISASAAIAYSKLALTGAILNADLAGSIAYSKLVLTGSVVNADIGAAAAIAMTKLAALSNSIVPVTNGSGVLTSSAVTATELGYVSGVTSAIQTQIGTKFTNGAAALNTGASGTAGTLSVFPTTAAKGKITLTAADSAGDTTTAIVNASQAGARTYTIPDAGASASFVMTAGTQTVSGVKTFDGQIIGKGTTTNDSAAAGYIGEYIESVVGNTNLPSTGTYGDLTSISLTAGDWDVTALMHINNNANFTIVIGGISVTSGNSATGLVDGSNRLYAIPSSTANTHITIANYRSSISGTTITYFKMNGSYTGTTPAVSGRISARRER